MNLNIKKYFLILSPLVLFFIFIKSNFLLSFFHELVNIFSGGRSHTKVFAYLLYLFLLLIIAYFLKYKKINFSFRKKILFLFLLISAYLVNFLSYIYFFIKYNFFYQEHVLIFNLNEFSSTYLLHNHTLKSIIAWVLNFFNITYLENIDSGMAFINIIPNIFILIGSILFLMVLFFSFYYFFHSIQFRSKYKFIYIILYSILSFSLLKNIIDGGFFNYEAIISLAFFILLVFYKKKWAKKTTIFLLIFYLIFNIVLYFLNFFDSFGVFIFNIYNSFVYVILLLIFFYSLQKNKRIKTLILTIILEILLLVFSFQSFINMRGYRNLEISKEDNALVATYDILDKDTYDFYNSINDLNFYEIIPQEKTKVQEVLKELKLLDNFYPVSIYWETCNPMGRYNRYSFNLLVEKEIKVHNFDNILNFYNFKLIGMQDGMYKYQVELNMAPCIPRSANVIEETFKSFGLKTFFIYKLHKDKGGGIFN